ncbi:unnamed protein product [Arctogadus glacialis]
MEGDEFFEVTGGSALEALVGQKGDLEFDPVLDRKPVEGFEDGCDVVVLPHPHQDPGSTILDVLQPLDVLAGDPDECIAVVQPGGDKVSARSSLVTRRAFPQLQNGFSYACYRTFACLNTRLLSSPCRPVCSPVSGSSPDCLPS